MSTTEWAMIILGASLGSYGLRVAPFLSERLYQLGKNNLRFLTYVSLAIAAGIVSRSIVFSGGQFSSLMAITIKVIAITMALLFFRFVKHVPIALFLATGLAILMKWLSQ